MNIEGYPKDFKENIIYRAKLLKACEVDEVLRAEVKALCKKDILFWVNCFCYTKDPRRKPDMLPFITYDDYQAQYILDVEKSIDIQEDLLTDKTRDMGISWMILYVFTHKWLFESGSDFRVGSRKEDFVDKLGDIDTLLEKVRFNLKRQPIWLLPKRFNFDEHAGYMKIVNPENGNCIIGESANEHFGSGGRRKAILLDEFAKWEEKVAEAAWTATADVARCRMVVSTPVGSANKFAQLANGTKEKIKRITLHWTLHPEKGKEPYYLSNGVKMSIASQKEAFKLWQSGIKVRSPWYDAEAERRSEADLAQEVDIDYLKSGHPFFSLMALAKQKIWDYFQRKTPNDVIPYGKHIRANLVEIDNKIELRESIDGWLRIFELPKEGCQYVLSADTSEGLAKSDESFLTIRDKWTRNIVAAANGFYPTDDFAIKIFKAGKFYKDTDIVPENNNHGHAVCQDLRNMDCKLYYTKHTNPNNEKETIIKPGWTTTSQSRPLALDQLEEEIRKDAIELRDEVLIAQCKTFVFNAKNGKPEADGSFLDDGVISCAIGSAIIKEIPFKARSDENTKAKQKQVVKEMQQPIGVFK